MQYGKESAFGAESGTITSAFGHDIRINIERRNNLIQTQGLGARNVQKLLASNFEGICTIEGILGTTHWIGAAWGSASTSGSTPYAHAYLEDDTLLLPSITIENGVDLGTTDSVVKLFGCKLDEMTITGAIGEPVRFRAVFFYVTEDETTSLDATPATDSETPFTFAQCSAELPNGTTLKNIQRLEFTLRNNLIKTWGLGSRFVRHLVEGKRGYEFSFDKTFENATMLETVYGAGTGPAATVTEQTLDFNITNGLSSSAERHFNIYLNGVKLDPFSNPQAPNEQIVETVTGIARTGSAFGEDNTSVTIFD